MASPTRPGVEVIQELSATPAVTASPTLVPMIVGICNQIITALDDEGALNPDAKFVNEQYNQSSMLVPQSEYPDPRGNIDEVNVYEDQVEASLFFGGSLTQLDRGSQGSVGSSFLKAMNLARRASIRSSEAGPFTFDGTVGTVLTMTFDKVNPADISGDVVVTFVGTLTAQETVDEINSTVGKDVATVFIDTDGDFGPALAEYVEIASLVVGATSSVTLRAGTAGLQILYGATLDDSLEYRVEGAGFRGQDDDDNDLSTPFVEFYQGAYFEDGVEATFPADALTGEVWAGLIDLDEVFTNAKAGAEVFSGPSATIPLVAGTSSVPGDQFWADGVLVGDAEIIKLEPTRFKLGKLNTSLSTFDDDGTATTRVYDTVEVNVPNHSNAFAPTYAYFVAEGLVAGEVVPAGVAATLTGTPAGVTTAERSAYVQTPELVFAPDINLASLTLDYEVVEDGVSSGILTHTFLGGPFLTAAAIAASIGTAIDGVTVTNSGDRVVFFTTKSGADQSFSIKSTGTANFALGLSTTAETEDTGKDIEYVVLAEITSEIISVDPGGSGLIGQGAASLHVICTDAKGVHDVTASPVDLSTGITNLGDLIDAIAVAFGGTAVTDRTLYEGGIAFATIESSGDTDAYGTITLKSIEGGPGVEIEVEAELGSHGFRHLGFYDALGGLWAEIESAVPPVTLPVAALDGATLTFTYDDGGGPYSQTAAVAGADGSASVVALAAALNGISALTDQGGSRALWFIGDDTAAAEKLIVRTVKGGAAVTLDGTAAAGNTNASVDIPATQTDVGAVTVGNADDLGANTLLGTTLGFFLDDNPFEYEASFTTNSLQDAIDEINEVVNGATDVASETAGALTLTSLLLGAASKVEVNDLSTAAIVLGLSGSADGSGRPNPDFWVDLLGAVVIGPSILRNGTTGEPFSLESALADVYISYVGLRLDVSAMAEDANTLTFTSVELMEESIGPISTANPLALGVFLAQQNAPTVDVSALGLDEQNDAAPEGTIDAWARALDLLESKEVYGIAPLTGDGFINQLVSTHVQAMSLPTNRGERIALLWQPPPLTEPDSTVSSGTDAEANGTDNSLTLETNPSADLIAAGFSLAGPIPVEEGLYLEVLVVDAGSTSLRRYSVEEVNGVLITLRVTFTGDDNIDGFYSSTPVDGSSGFDNLDWTLKVRGAPLLVPGTTRLDLTAVAAAAGSESQPYLSRRVYMLYGAAVDTSVNGITQKVPLYYAAAAISGMIAQLSPEQPFTNVPITGFNRVYGTDDTFSENQMDVIADGGRYVLVNNGGTVASRHSRSTDPTSIEARELSITKSIDWLAKGVRSTNRVFIGRFVIDQGFLDQLTMANEGFLSFAVQLGVVAKARLTDILQDESEPDTILINIEATPKFPANKIRVTIVA